MRIGAEPQGLHSASMCHQPQISFLLLVAAEYAILIASSAVHPSPMLRKRAYVSRITLPQQLATIHDRVAMDFAIDEYSNLVLVRSSA